VATAPVLLDQWTVDYAHVRWLNVGLTFEGGPRHGLGHLDARLSEPLPTPRETQKNGGAGLNYSPTKMRRHASTWAVTDRRHAHVSGEAWTSIPASHLYYITARRMRPTFPTKYVMLLIF